jgi:hypothetical protein
MFKTPNNYQNLQMVYNNLIILTKNSNRLTEFIKFKFNNNNLLLETHLFENGNKKITNNKIIKQQKENKFKIYNKLNRFIFIFEIGINNIIIYNDTIILYNKQTKLIPYFIYENFDNKILNYYIDLLDENKIRISRIILDYNNTLLFIDNNKFNNFIIFKNIDNNKILDHLYLISDPNLYIQEQLKTNIIIKNNIWLKFIIKTIENNNLDLFNTKILYKNELLIEFLTEKSPSFIIKDDIFLYIDVNKLYNLKNELILKCKTEINSFFILNNKLYIIDKDLNIYENMINELNFNLIENNNNNNNNNKIHSIKQSEEKDQYNEYNNNEIKKKIQLLLNKDDEYNRQLKTVIEKNYDLLEMNNNIDERFDIFKKNNIDINNKIDLWEDNNDQTKTFILKKIQEIEEDLITVNDLLNK